MIDIDRTVEQIFGLYRKHGSQDYIGEEVTQTQHAVQCAMIAEMQQQSVPTVIGALLHDIGHLVGMDAGMQRMVTGGQVLGICRHEVIGQQFLLDMSIPKEIADFSKGHVDAKRYLTYKNRDYYNSLSEASKMTLGHQGGVMTQKEAEEFEANPRFKALLSMRKWDEQAKDPNLEIKPLSYYESLLRDYLKSVLNK